MYERAPNGLDVKASSQKAKRCKMNRYKDFFTCPINFGA